MTSDEELREALGVALSALLGWQLGQTTRDEHAAATVAARAALATPLRNCDVGTPEEQQRRFNRFCKRYGCALGGDENHKCPLSYVSCEFEWGQMSYMKEVADE